MEEEATFTAVQSTVNPSVLSLDSLLEPIVSTEPPLTCFFERVNDTAYSALIRLDHQIVHTLYRETAQCMQGSVTVPGFMNNNVPISYIEEHFKENIIEHLKEFFLKYCVINYLYNALREKKIVVAGDPQLQSITWQSTASLPTLYYNFHCPLFADLCILEWKYLPFKSPKRKNYKDIDRQVENFVAEEKKNQELYNGTNLICPGDWVHFSLAIAPRTSNPLPKEFAQEFWINSGNETEGQIQDLFLGKKKGDAFDTSCRSILLFLSNQLEVPYHFLITIIDVVPHSYVCFDLFKRHFKLKTYKDLHKKIIEVFSLRNDLSQRRCIVDEAYKLVLSRHPVSIPEHAIIGHKKTILRTVQENPDYTVYRMQKDFEHKVMLLAEKQMKEALFTDSLAYHENLSIIDDDVKSYLNLAKRSRTKELIHFDLPAHQNDGEEIPIPHEILKKICLREKTLNHLIYYLMKA